MDDIMRALSNVHRRRLLVALLDHNPHRESLDIPKDVHEGEKELETLQLEFHHSHLPRLEAAGLICWNRERNDVVKGPRFDEVRPFLELERINVDELSEDSLNTHMNRPHP